jgi:hypothetical protein
MLSTWLHVHQRFVIPTPSCGNGWSEEVLKEAR